MEKPEAKWYRKGVVNVLKALPNKEARKSTLRRVRENPDYQEAKKIHVESSERKNHTEGSVETARPPEQIANEIITLLGKNPYLEFFVGGIGNILDTDKSGGTGWNVAVAGTRTKGKMKIVRDNHDRETSWGGYFANNPEIDYFDPWLHVHVESDENRVYFVRTEKIKALRMDLNSLFGDNREGLTLSLGFSIPNSHEALKSIGVQELHDAFLSMDNQMDQRLDRTAFNTVLDLVAKHFIPRYFNHIQELARKYHDSKTHR